MEKEVISDKKWFEFSEQIILDSAIFVRMIKFAFIGYYTGESHKSFYEKYPTFRGRARVRVKSWHKLEAFDFYTFRQARENPKGTREGTKKFVF